MVKVEVGQVYYTKVSIDSANEYRNQGRTFNILTAFYDIDRNRPYLVIEFTDILERTSDSHRC